MDAIRFYWAAEKTFRHQQNVQVDHSSVGSALGEDPLFCKVCSLDQQYQLQQGAREKCRILGPTPDQLNQNLHFNKPLPQVTCCTRKCEEPISSQQSHLPSLRSGVLSTSEVPVLCSTTLGVFPLRGGPLNLAKALANQRTSSRGFNEENKMFQVVQLS